MMIISNTSVFQMQEKANDDIPMPTFFRFLALLAFKIFAGEKV
jgi:folylpolyglutamate synthase